MNEPNDDDKCLACEHPWLHHESDPAELWKNLTDCECCLGGEFVGEPIAVDDMDDDQLEAWKAWRKPR